MRPQQLATWLAAGDAVAPAGDERFADDAETVSPAVPRRLKPAAVLVLLVARDEPWMVFTRRTAHLKDHAGQISFPGGRVDEADAHAEATALRETEEETGIDPDAIELLGRLPQYTTGTGYLITPVVGWARAAPRYRPDPSEVEAVFEVPAAFVLDPRNHRCETAMYKGRMRRYYAIPYREHYIWGATAGMLVTLTRVLAAARGEAYRPPLTVTDSGG